MSQITELGSGALTVTDHLTIELVEADEAPVVRPMAGQANYLAPAALSRRPSIERTARAVSAGNGLNPYKASGSATCPPDRSRAAVSKLTATPDERTAGRRGLWRRPPLATVT